MKCPDCGFDVHIDNQLLGGETRLPCPKCGYELVIVGPENPLMHFLKQ